MDAPLDDAQPLVEAVAEASGAPAFEKSYSAERTAEQIIADIDEALEAAQKPAHPKRIRASSFGAECGRQLAYDFLWATPTSRTIGRMLRLFKDGDAAEPELLGYLKSVGYEVLDRDPDNPRKQVWIEALDGHVGGYLDGLGRDRAGQGPWRVIECKSHNKNSFSKLKRDGVELSKPEHAGQFALYAYKLGLMKALYIAKNKDDSDIHIELIDVSESYVQRLLERAEAIIGKRVLPPKVSESVKSHKCKFCRHGGEEGICHGGAAPERNCRTCQFSKAGPAASWLCERHRCVIEKSLAVTGCADYEIHDLFKPPETSS